jgi:hypothetical protein
MSRQLLALLGTLTLAGCATTGGHSYYYDREGDYYYAAPRADVILDSSRYYGGAGLHYGWGGYAYSPWGWGGYSGYGYGYGFSPWYYPSPIWVTPKPPAATRDGRIARVERERSGRGALLERGDVARPDLSPPYRPAADSRRDMFSRDAMPSTNYSPMQRERRAPVGAERRESNSAFDVSRRSVPQFDSARRPTSAPPLRAPSPSPRTHSVPPSRSVPAQRRE